MAKPVALIVDQLIVAWPSFCSSSVCSKCVDLSWHWPTCRCALLPGMVWPDPKWPNLTWHCVAQPSVALFATAQAGVAWVEPANLPFLLSPQPDAAPRAAAPRSLASLRTLSQHLSFFEKKTWKRELARSFCKVNEVDTGILKIKLRSYVFIMPFQPTITIVFLRQEVGFGRRFKCKFVFFFWQAEGEGQPTFAPYHNSLVWSDPVWPEYSC